MDAGEDGLAVIEVVAALAEVEVQDVDGIDFLHLVVLVAYLDVFGDGLGHSVEHALEVVELAGELNLYDDYLTLAVDGLDVYAVELGLACLLVALAFQQLAYDYLLAQKDGDETFEDGKVGLVAKHALHGPIEAYVLVLCLHFDYCACVVCAKIAKLYFNCNSLGAFFDVR